MRTLGSTTKWMKAGILAVMAGSSLALADIPAALDRVPADAPVIISVRDIEGFKSRVLGMLEQLKIPFPGHAMEGLNEVLGTTGLNTKGSAALSITPPSGDMGGEPDFVMILPVSDAKAVIKARGGNANDAIATIKMGDSDAESDKGYAKDIGGGYMAISNTKQVIEKFSGVAGSLAAHSKAFGESGRRVADTADVMIIANIPQMRETLEGGLAQMKDQMEGMAAMMGEQGQQVADALKMVTMISETFIRDSQVGIIGLGIDAKGVNIDLATNFKEGSEVAGLMSAKGNAAAITSRLPGGDFLFAMSMDWTSPGMQKLIRGAADMSKGAAGDKSPMMGNMAQMAAMLDKADGQGVLIGASDLGAGLFANSCIIYPSKDSAKVGEMYQKMTLEMNGQVGGPIKMKTEYKPNVKEFGGIKAGSYSVTFEQDPNDPAAAQMQMVMPMLFGPEGKIAGYTAAAPGAFISTMSMNSELMQRAIDAAKSGKGVNEDALVKQTAERLPPDRAIEGYIGVKAILDMVQGFMAMMGNAPEMQLPEKLAPVGFGLTMSGGGAQMRIHVPNDVIKTAVGLGQQFGAQGDMEGDEPMEAEKPKF